MTINRRRAPSSEISRDKKMGGHMREIDYATLIGGNVILGTQKGDVKDANGNLHSVKSGKKWQMFLYGYNRISNCSHLNILKPCLDAFPADYQEDYLPDREKCIKFKERYSSDHGVEAAKILSNDDVIKSLGSNSYINAKEQLAKASISVSKALEDKSCLQKFLGEALFNNNEVQYLAVKDTTYINDGLFKVFTKEDVLEVLTKKLAPAISSAGRVAIDYNVSGQKTLLRYRNSKGKPKNIIEIEIRNDSKIHYKQVRFNMYSKDTLFLLSNLPKKKLCEGVLVYGRAIINLCI